jgi:hypothetical protein
MVHHARLEAIHLPNSAHQSRSGRAARIVLVWLNSISSSTQSLPTNHACGLTFCSFARLYYSLFLPYRDIEATAQAANYCSHQELATLLFLREDKCNWLKLLLVRTHKMRQQAAASCLMHMEDIHTPRLLVTRPHGLCVNLAVRRGYSSLGRSGSTSTTPYAAMTSFSGRTTTSTTHLDWFQLEN